MPPVEPNNASGLQRTAPTVLPVAVLVSATLLAYANSFSGPFVFDDIATIVDSPSIRTLSPVWPVLFQGGVSSVGRPLVNLSLALNYAWGGMDVTSWHVVNLTLHIVAGITFFGVIRRTLEQSPVAASLRDHGTVIAMFCSLIWLLHPLQTESVTYIVQRAESLAGLFYFLTLYFAIRSASSERSGLWGTAAFLACLCGVGSKEVIVSAPLAVIVYDWALFGRTIRSVSHRRRWLYAALFSTWIPLIFLVAQGRHESAGFGYGLGAWDYAMTQFGAITRYLYLCFWPNSLVLDYGASVTRNASEIIPGAIIVGLLAGGSVAAIRYQPWVAFLGFFFFAVLSPSSSFIPLVTQTVAEHRMYLPLASVVVIAVLIVWHLCRAILRKLYPGPSETGSVIACVVLALIAIYSGYLTKERNAEYKDPIRLWTSNIERCTESLRPYIQVGALYLEQNPRTAIYLFDRAIEGYQQTQERNGV
ncbi:MAG: hypothetical protein KDB01_24065, partial [Planctomycetaceae bacterium]|nr:hypothetical protein [Planctomycetaceae bacterium]